MLAVHCLAVLPKEWPLSAHPDVCPRSLLGRRDNRCTMARRTAIACLALLSSPSFAAHVANRHATRRLQNSEVGVGQCNRTCMRSAALLGTAY